ncbi:regulator of microtubule dynamics protein 2 isoform X2 [Ochotona princeps]|uniref:regulator of microtubule dynamics protein 2 isoform X2 n=1 Tax=Ochotona princeps TaxID=9978 RepID=UPI0027152FBB|nr:regulator of microtubule dynamics protein 2 isoform X2 [Ochotona princeps]
MGECLSCCCEDRVTTEPQLPGASSRLQACGSSGFKVPHPSATYKVHSPRGSAQLSLSNTSTSSFISAKRYLSGRLQKSYTFPSEQQSRANFESQEEASSPDLNAFSESLAAFPSRRRFSSRKLSVVSYYKSAIFWTPQLSNQDMFNLSEIELFSESPNNTDAKKHMTFSTSEFGNEHFWDFETKTTSDHQSTIDKVAHQRSTASLGYLPTVISSHGDIQEDNQYITANTDTEEPSFPVSKALNTHVEELSLDVLLQKVDNLRLNESGKLESFELLCDHKEKFRDEVEFMWRFARGYGDMYELSTHSKEKKHYANIGRTVGERAVSRAPMNGYCHLWYAVLCGYVSEFEGLQNKINCGHYFKEHLDIAIQLLPDEPFLYYLKGRYCYTVSKLSWIEKKMAATLFGKIPSSTVPEALQNFLKAEELHPGFSLPNYMYLAKCYTDLNQNQNALKFCDLALLLPSVTKEDRAAQTEVKNIMTSLKRLLDLREDRIAADCS